MRASTIWNHRQLFVFLAKWVVAVTIVLQIPIALQAAQLDLDADEDGIEIPKDNCPTVFNPNQVDGDRDGVGDACDNCPKDANADQSDTDTDSFGDTCDQDDDNDGLNDGQDNCPYVSNQDQMDDDKDGVGNLCDNCPQISNAIQQDTDGDGAGDACEKGELISSIEKTPAKAVLGDRVSYAVQGNAQNGVALIKIFANGMEKKICYGLACMYKTPMIESEPEFGVLVVNGDARLEAAGRVPQDAIKSVDSSFAIDADGDGVPNLLDNCINTANPDQDDLDGDTVGDACDECCPDCNNMGFPVDYCCLAPFGDGGGDCRDEVVTPGGVYYWEYAYTDISSNGCGCYDSDGNDIFKSGGIRTETEVAQDCTHIDGGSYCQGPRSECTFVDDTTDTCVSENTVREYLCGPDGPTFDDVRCPKENPVCDDGRCSCPDTDGGRNFYERGTLLGHTDSCFSNSFYTNGLKEYHCDREYSSGELKYKELLVECPFGCSGGACTCEDSDGGVNPSVKGRIGIEEDICWVDRTLWEAYVEVVPDEFGGSCQIRREFIECDGLCADGACQPPTCTDHVQNQGEEDIDCGGPCPLPCDLASITEDNLPVRFFWGDYKGKSWITPIKNQGSCGSCAAFAVTAAMESVALIEHTNGWIPQNFVSWEENLSNPVPVAIALPDLSEQALISGCTSAWVDCTGGGHRDVLSGIRDDGVVDQRCMGYNSSNCLDDDNDCLDACGGRASECANPTTCPEECDDPGIGSMESREWFITRHDSLDVHLSANKDIVEVKMALLNEGPLPNCCSDMKHCLTIVGWDNDSTFCRSRYPEDGDDGCWILENSHGAGGLDTARFHQLDENDDGFWSYNGFVYIPFKGHDYSRCIRNGVHTLDGVIPPDAWGMASDR